MHDRPDPDALLDMLAEVLRTTILPQLGGPAAYQARIAANVAAMMARQARQTASDDTAELERLRAILGRDGDLSGLNAELARRLRTGDCSFDDPAVRTHLWQTTFAKLAVDQPSYARYRQLALNT